HDLLISGPNLGESLKEGGRSLTGGSARSRLRSSLVIGEVALSLVLLTGAGLLIRSFWAIKSIDPGFRAGNVLAMNIEPPLSRYVEPPQRVAYFDRVLERVVSLPGVSS